MGRAKMWTLGISAVVILVGFQLWLPYRLETALEQAIARSGVAVHGVTVEVRSFPAIELFMGHVDRLRLQLKEIESEVPVKSAELDLTGISFNASAALQGQRLQITAVDGGRGEVVVTEEALDKYLSRTVGAGSLVSVKLSGGLGVVSGSFRAAGLQLELILKGTFTPAGAGLRFTPRDLSVMDASVPKFILDELANQLSIDIPLGDLPVPMEVREVRAESGELQVVVVPAMSGAPASR